MTRFFAVVVLAATLVAGCTTTASETAGGRAAATRPDIAPDARILMIEPDVELSELLASGLQEPKAEWSSAARDNIRDALTTAFETRGLAVKRMEDPTALMDGRMGQVMRLHEAVAESILAFRFFQIAALPTKRNTFDWTIGEGAQLLGAMYEADYALYTLARGSYASSGRKAMAVAGLVGAAFGFGVSVPLGGQQVYSQLIDLRTGQVVWAQVAGAAPGVDMREDPGATSLVQAILKDSPL